MHPHHSWIAKLPLALFALAPASSSQGTGTITCSCGCRKMISPYSPLPALGRTQLMDELMDGLTAATLHLLCGRCLCWRPLLQPGAQAHRRLRATPRQRVVDWQVGCMVAQSISTRGDDRARCWLSDTWAPCVDDDRPSLLSLWTPCLTLHSWANRTAPHRMPCTCLDTRLPKSFTRFIECHYGRSHHAVSVCSSFSFPRSLRHHGRWQQQRRRRRRR